jgi:hypothetical protein
VETVSDDPPLMTAPYISFVNAAAFSRAAKMPDAEVFMLNITDPSISIHSPKISSLISQAYWKIITISPTLSI